MTLSKSSCFTELHHAPLLYGTFICGILVCVDSPDKFQTQPPLETPDGLPGGSRSDGTERLRFAGAASLEVIVQSEEATPGTRTARTWDVEGTPSETLGDG